MIVRSIRTAGSDRIFLADGSKVLEHCPDEDLECRKSQIIEDLYHRDWFRDYNDAVYFTPPAAYIEKGKILFINGRHRTILLTRHVKIFPFLIGNIDMDNLYGKPTEGSLTVFDEIKHGEYEEHSEFELPDIGFGNFEAA